MPDNDHRSRYHLLDEYAVRHFDDDYINGRDILIDRCTDDDCRRDHVHVLTDDEYRSLNNDRCPEPAVHAPADNRHWIDWEHDDDRVPYDDGDYSPPAHRPG